MSRRLHLKKLWENPTKWNSVDESMPEDGKLIVAVVVDPATNKELAYSLIYSKHFGLPKQVTRWRYS